MVKQQTWKMEPIELDQMRVVGSAWVWISSTCGGVYCVIKRSALQDFLWVLLLLDVLLFSLWNFELQLNACDWLVWGLMSDNFFGFETKLSFTTLTLPKVAVISWNTPLPFTLALRYCNLFFNVQCNLQRRHRVTPKGMGINRIRACTRQSWGRPDSDIAEGITQCNMQRVSDGHSSGL